MNNTFKDFDIKYKNFIELYLLPTINNKFSYESFPHHLNSFLVSENKYSTFIFSNVFKLIFKSENFYLSDYLLSFYSKSKYKDSLMLSLHLILKDYIIEENKLITFYILNNNDFEVLSFEKSCSKYYFSLLSSIVYYNDIDMIKILIEKYGFLPNEFENSAIIKANLKFADSILFYLFSFDSVKISLKKDDPILYPEIKQKYEKMLFKKQIKNF